MRPRVVACHFRTNTNGDPKVWPRLARVFRHTAARHLPGWDLDIQELEPLPIRSSRALPADGHNTQKLDHWVAAVAGLDDGARVAFMDADTAILRPLDDVWDLDFDLALTRRPRGYPYNGGVVFLRMSLRLRMLLEVWAETNRLMLVDRGLHAKWQARYGGINQAALGAVLENPCGLAERLRIIDLPCAEWNCEDETWEAFDGRTRVLHVKSILRSVIFPAFYEPAAVSMARRTPMLVRLADVWLRLEREALAQESRPVAAGMEATP